MSKAKRKAAARKATATRKRREAAEKAARTKAENYAKASAEEKARIDEVRHFAAEKAARTKKLKRKKPKTSEHISRKTDWSAAVEKAENTGKAAVEITKWRINQLPSRTKWQLVEFMGKGGKESAGIVDLLAIRKDHEKKVKKVGLKPGDLFEILLIQVKGGNASWPSKDDIRRLQILGRYYDASNIVLSEWKDSRLTFYRLKEGLNQKQKFSSKEAWIKVFSLNDIFP